MKMYLLLPKIVISIYCIIAVALAVIFSNFAPETMLMDILAEPIILILVLTILPVALWLRRFQKKCMDKKK